MKPMWFSEIEPFPCAVLQHHWPHVPNFGDMNRTVTGVQLGTIGAPDVLVGGTPCQAFSVAGSRESLDDDRGQLTLQYVRILNAIDAERKSRGLPPAACVWENVPGVLTTKDNAFGCFLGELAGSGCELQPPGGKWRNAGYVSGPQRSIAWRIIDAQYFGVAQRRRRVFVVASARDGFDPRKVLFESEGVRRDTPPSRETGAPVAALTANGVGTCGADDNQGQAGHLIVHGTQDPCVSTDVAFCLGRNNGGENALLHRLVAFGEYVADGTASTMLSRNYKDAWDLVAGSRVRKLTEVECARLQGFPDHHTLIPWRGKPAEQCPAGPQYKAYGNSKATVCVRWLGVRLIRELSK